MWYCQILCMHVTTKKNSDANSRKHSTEKKNRYRKGDRCYILDMEMLLLLLIFHILHLINLTMILDYQKNKHQSIHGFSIHKLYLHLLSILLIFPIEHILIFFLFSHKSLPAMIYIQIR